MTNRQMEQTGDFEVTTPSDRKVVLTRSFDAPPGTVFEAWTKPEHVTHWWDPSGAPLEVCEIDLRPGGAFRWVNSDGGGQHSFSGSYVEITAPDRLVFKVNMFASHREPVATLLFREVRGKTSLTITMECDSREDRDALLQMRIPEGTGRTLGNLAEYLARVDKAALRHENS